ncbi:MAG: hypothetical protein SPL73_05700 [Cyanobacteriota bacterium]|nr:hypothetical protein [Cyanobacteriota bacterium]MDY6364366.1 hypothetical protein [Cyanobacteriota bacterium]
MQAYSKIDEIYKTRQRALEKQKQLEQNLKKSCSEIFSTVNGKFFLKYLKRICLWSEQDTNINPETVLYKKGRRDIWTIIRNVIPRDVLAQIEIYDTENEQQQ